MRIVIDLQGAQCGSRHRGIGRYSLALAQAIVRNRGDHEIIIALNGLFPDTIEPIRAAFDGILEQKNIRVWHTAGPVHAFDPTNTWRRLTAELIREAFLVSLKPDIVHLSSLIEGFGDDAVHSIGSLPVRIPTAATFYDVIPLIQSDVYLTPHKIFEVLYREKLGHLSRADLYLAISESSRLEAIDYLGAKSEQAINIGAAADEIFKPINISAHDEKNTRKHFGLHRPFLMYSGATDERKNHLRLIKAFSLLPISLRKQYQLAIVGGLPPHHKSKFKEYVKFCGLTNTDVIITDRVNDHEMLNLYNLCNLFVFPSWHEGFGLPALEAMSCGAAVIGSNTTSLPEVIGRADALFDPFDEISISRKIESVLTDETLRNELARHGLEQAKLFSWDESAKRSLNAFEVWHEKNLSADVVSKDQAPDLISLLVQNIAKISSTGVTEQDWLTTAKSISKNHNNSLKSKLLVDISQLVRVDSKTGVQRVVRGILTEILEHPPKEFEVHLVYAVPGEPGYRYAKEFTKKFLGENVYVEEDADVVVDVFNNDIFLGLDFQPYVVSEQLNFFSELKRIGAKTYFVVYDLLPVISPQFFPADASANHARWLTTMTQTDGVLCISKAVADDMAEWLTVFGPQRLRPFNIGWFHLGGDVSHSVPTKGVPVDSASLLKSLSKRPTFLSVGTIEPRKGQMQTFAAFERLWAQGEDVNFVLVGKHGWNVDLLVEMLRSHPEWSNRLFWLDSVSDEYLEKIYVASTCLIAASEGEGFGLPLIEAAQHKKPIIARDIPVFREVAGEYAFYFSGLEPEVLADAVLEWLDQYKNGKAPKSEEMHWLTWKQSTENLLDVMLNDKWYKKWMPDKVLRYWGSDSRLGTEIGVRTGQNVKSSAQMGYLTYGPYVPLEAGHYRLDISGSIEYCDLSSAHVDVVANNGTLVIAKEEFFNQSLNGLLISIELQLVLACTDLQVRIWVNENAVAVISMIEIEPCVPNSLLRIPATDARFGTQVGSRDGAAIETTGNEGYLLYGPYISLPIGKYKITVRGTCHDAITSGAFMDIVIGEGDRILASSKLVKSEKDGILVCLFLDIDFQCDDLEIRVWVYKDSIIEVSMLEILLLTDIEIFT